MTPTLARRILFGQHRRHHNKPNFLRGSPQVTTVSQSTVFRILTSLKFYPYKLQLGTSTIR
jgi:hypothetical protein